MIDIEAIRQRHLRPEQMEHRTFYEGHICIDLGACLDEIAALRERLEWMIEAIEREQDGRTADRDEVVNYLLRHAEKVRDTDGRLAELAVLTAARAIDEAGYPLNLTLPGYAR
jgi:hypothetical protein